VGAQRVGAVTRAGALLAAWILWCLSGPFSPLAAAELWIDIDTAARRLAVMDGDATVRVFENISVGRNGVSTERVVEDRTTPLGSYRVRRINRESRFRIYFGFDYPNLEQAQRAFRAGRISYDQLKAIRRAHYLEREPPSDTPLGGQIGIHGIGNGDSGIHEDFDWTDGCIAVTNEEVDELAQWLRLGTRVEVR
jgi:lipoprotein-anchoring transpeptidase ErfK/SrfK